MLHPALSRALATAHIEDLQRAAARSHAIHLARRVGQEPHVVAASDLPIVSERMWTGHRGRHSRRDRLPMRREMRSERL
jgi:hypothetical protein